MDHENDYSEGDVIEEFAALEISLTRGDVTSDRALGVFLNIAVEKAYNDAVAAQAFRVQIAALEISVAEGLTREARLVGLVSRLDNEVARLAAKVEALVGGAPLDATENALDAAAAAGPRFAVVPPKSPNEEI